MNNMEGRVAFVTGASRGIGRAIALQLAAAGASVAVCAREDHAASVASEIIETGGIAEALSVDVSDSASLMCAVETATEKIKGIDILVNNAGIVKDQLVMRMKANEWETVINTNLTAAFQSTQGVLRSMLKQRWGRIINISSVVGQSGNPGQANYAASKAGLIGFSKALAREVASRGITVNVVAPGFIETDMTAELDEKARASLSKQIPLGRIGRSIEVAYAVCFLASDEASYITGQVIAVNGGMYM